MPSNILHEYANVFVEKIGTYTVHEETVTVYNSTCPTKTSVLALAVTCALLLLMYICTVFYFLMRRWLGPDKRV